MLRVLSFLKPYRRSMSFAILFMFTELIVELWHPVLMAKIINEGITQKDLSVVLQWGGLMMLLALVGFISGILNSFLAAHASQNFGFDIRKSLFVKIQSFSFANFNQFPTSTLITRVTNDVNLMQGVVFMSLRIMMRAPLLIIGGLIMAMMVNVKLALILAVVTPLLLVFLVWIMNRGFKLFRSVQNRLDRVNSVLRENLLGMKLIKAFVRANHEIKRFTQANMELKDRTIAALRLVELTIPRVILIMNFSLLAILWFGSFEVNREGASIGEVVAVVNYATRITAAFSAVSMILNSIARARASAGRLSDVLETKVDLKDVDEADSNPKIKEGELLFEEVSFQYPGNNVQVLKSISFTIKPRETVAILGATGSGKSSLFQLIPRLYDVDAGRILIDNIDIKSVKLEVLRNQIGFVPQEALLFTGTVKENIQWGRAEATMEEIIEAAKSAQIHETIMKFPQQYNTVLGQKGVNLSGGQKQRISIARALVRKPKLLLLDDSTSALDMKTEANLLTALKKYPATTLIITQKISTALQADSIILLEDGELVAKGSHEELAEHSALYRQIIHSQFGEERLTYA